MTEGERQGSEPQPVEAVRDREKKQREEGRKSQSGELLKPGEEGSQRLLHSVVQFPCLGDNLVSPSPLFLYFLSQSQAMRRGWRPTFSAMGVRNEPCYHRLTNKLMVLMRPLLQVPLALPWAAQPEAPTSVSSTNPRGLSAGSPPFSLGLTFCYTSFPWLRSCSCLDILPEPQLSFQKNSPHCHSWTVSRSIGPLFALL